MKKHCLFFFLLVFMLSSCNKVYYQVYSIKSQNVRDMGTEMVHENNDVKIAYNLWSEGGNPGFTIYNKTKEDLYVILPQTFFIKNDKANDYFLNREFSSSETNALTNTSFYQSFFGNNLAVTVNKSKNTKFSSGIVYVEKQIIGIPARSSKTINEYIIQNSYFRDCDKRVNFPKRQSSAMKYNRNDSPLVFKNRITYSFNQDGTDSKIIENEFYVSEIVNYSHKELVEKVDVKECDSDVKDVRYLFKTTKPYQFYNIYTKK